MSRNVPDPVKVTVQSLNTEDPHGDLPLLLAWQQTVKVKLLFIQEKSYEGEG